MVTLPPSGDCLPFTRSSTGPAGLAEKSLPSRILPVARPSAIVLMLSAALSGLSVLLSLPLATFRA